MGVAHALQEVDELVQKDAGLDPDCPPEAFHCVTWVTGGEVPESAV